MFGAIWGWISQGTWINWSVNRVRQVNPTSPPGAASYVISAPHRCPAVGQHLESVATILAEALDAYESYGRTGRIEILDAAGARLGRIHEDLDGFVASLDSAWGHQTDADCLVDLQAAASALEQLVMSFDSAMTDHTPVSATAK